MVAVPLKVSKSTFLINQTNFMILKGVRLNKVELVALSSTTFKWLNATFDQPPMNSRYLLIHGNCFYGFVPPVPDDPNIFLPDDLTVTLTSRDGAVRSLLIPAFYVPPKLAAVQAGRPKSD